MGCGASSQQQVAVTASKPLEAVPIVKRTHIPLDTNESMSLLKALEAAASVILSAAKANKVRLSKGVQFSSESEEALISLPSNHDTNNTSSHNPSSSTAVGGTRSNRRASIITTPQKVPTRREPAAIGYVTTCGCKMFLPLGFHHMVWFQLCNLCDREAMMVLTTTVVHSYDNSLHLLLLHSLPSSAFPSSAV